ncbi:hypothetical protein Syun_019672 [Stephania yunnanensis]|uniref:Small subunit processome component 20 homolog n=1 Tax=Stephania yunnanensis TaxID=152371 RepID=A0AAP0IVQ7_9MAGN
MATPSHSLSVKSLNKGSGRGRFVFKKFSQKVNEIDIDVFRSLELNTAEDFISFYEEVMPLAQTLPQILLHKKTIMSKLESRLNMGARLSLEPLLRLTAALSRDLLEDFLPFLSTFTRATVGLLQNGAEREPEIIEQIFTSWSYIMMFLQKYLVQDVVHLLKTTHKLRYYPKDYVQEFMAVAVSFLLRSAPNERQVIKGIRQATFEAVKKPSLLRESAVSSLFFNSMRGTPSRFHSKAELVLRLLLDGSIIDMGDSSIQGPGTVVKVVAATFQRLFAELHTEEHSLIWDCLFDEISAVGEGSLAHLDRLLSLLISAIQFSNGRKVSDYRPMLKVVNLLIQNFITCTYVKDPDSYLYEVVDKVLQAMLCILDSLPDSVNGSVYNDVSLEWSTIFEASVFDLRNRSLISFIKELLLRDPRIVDTFKGHILSVVNRFIGVPSSAEDALFVMMKFLEKLSMNKPSSWNFDGISENKVSRFLIFIQEYIDTAINEISHWDPSTMHFNESRAAILWGILNCYPYIFAVEANASLILNLVHGFDHILEIRTGLPKLTWQSLLGAALACYHRLLAHGMSEPAEMKTFLNLAKKHRSSPQVLLSVAEFLDSVDRCPGPIVFHPELKEENANEAISIFADNLLSPDSDFRMSTLRILSHYEPLKTDTCQACSEDGYPFNVSYRASPFHRGDPLSVCTSRKIVNFISRIQMGLSASRISETYSLLLLTGLIGIFQKRFAQLWAPTLECLSVLIDKNVGTIWGKYVHYLEQFQIEFFTFSNQPEKTEDPGKSEGDNEDPCKSEGENEDPGKSSDLAECFSAFLNPDIDSTPCATVLSLVESFNAHFCKGREWRGVLKDWLNLIKAMRNPRLLRDCPEDQFSLEDVLKYRLLDHNDADLQMKVLDCLLIWEVSKDCHHIQEHHREFLVPLIIRVLMPKVRKLKTISSRKQASIDHRKAVLGFLTQLDVDELRPFFDLLVTHLSPVSFGNIAEYLRFSDVDKLEVKSVNHISWKKRNAFLHVTEDILKSFDEQHLKPFLSLLMGIVVKILESCTLELQSCQDNERSEVKHTPTGVRTYLKSSDAILPARLKDQRSLCLKIVSLVLNKFEDYDFGIAFWDLFFKSVKSLIDGFKQEGSSSERPSSLFSCFLAMSRSHQLVSLLNREENLVPSILSILTMKTTSDAMVISVLSFIENLLNLHGELDDKEDLAMKGILLPNVAMLISSLHSFFQCCQETRRKLMRQIGKTEYRIFKLLPKYIKDPLVAEQFVDIALQFLGQKTQESDNCREALHAIQGVIPVMGGKTSGKFLNVFAPLLTSAGLDVRLSICNLLDALASKDPSITVLAKLICELNAISSTEIDELDYDTRVSAYEKVDPKFFSTFTVDRALIILSHSVYDMSSEDLILRQSASMLFISFVRFCSFILDHQVVGGQEMLECEMAAETNTCWTKACVQRIIKKFFLNHMSKAMNKDISIQREWIALLQEMVLRLPALPALSSIRDLCSKDAEVDFFNNILHLQKHRRARALARFRNVIASSGFSQIILKKIFIPLFFKMLLVAEDENIRNACVESLATISGQMQWELYSAFLNRCFREMIFHSDKQKVFLRLICSVLDRFHFKETSFSQELGENCSHAANSGAFGGNKSGFLDIQIELQKKVLPKIQKLLNADSERVNVMVNLAALKLLKLLPVDVMESQLPSIIQRICNFLKNRMEGIREDARSALAACVKELGLEYLQFIVKTLRATLKRGYELHVLGYTVNFILSKALAKPVSGKLDYCLGELLSVAENDIFGNVAEEKEVEKIASKMKETRTKEYYFEMLKRIAQNITFKSHALKLLSPIKAHLHRHLTPTLKEKLDKMLRRIAEGIQDNPSANQNDLFVFVYGLIENGFSEETLQHEDSLSAEMRNSSVSVGGNLPQSYHIIMVFALRILQTRLSKIRLDKKDAQLLSMLDPFVKLLGRCLNSKYEDVLSEALKCLPPLLRLPLPSLVMQANGIKTLLLDIVQKAGNTGSPLIQACLKLLTVLLKSTCSTLSSDELHMLIQFPLFIDLERNPSFLALSLLKAIVGRKLIVHEIYDLVTQVAYLMVRSTSEPIRKKSSQILLQFLLDYQLSQKRMQQHLEFLLENLGYEHPTGREAVLEMLHAIIVKFPRNVVNGQAQTFFPYLVLRLANEQDDKVRSMVGSTLKLLIGHTSQEIRLSMLEHIVSCYKDENKNLWSTAAQVSGLFVEVLKRGFERHINSVLPVVKKILKSSLDAVANRQRDDSEVAAFPLWKEAYYSLVMLEKMLVQFPELYLERDLEEVWEAICEFLLHPHSWLRSISSRLLSRYFSAASEACRENGGSVNLENPLLMKPSRLFRIAVSFCCQLKAQLNDDAACIFISQNLGFAICGMHSFAERGQNCDQEFWLKEQGHFVKSFQLLGSRKDVSMLALLTSFEKVEHGQNCDQDLHSILVSPLLKKMGKVALQMEDIQMKTVFNCLQMISSQIGAEGCQRYAIDILLPLYKVCEGFSGKIISDDVMQLAVQVRDVIKRILGTENFVKTYNEIRKTMKAKRDKKKQEEKIMAVVDPMRNAKRKRRIADKHKANKKRKMMSMKLSRQMIGNRNYRNL